MNHHFNVWALKGTCINDLKMEPNGIDALKAVSAVGKPLACAERDLWGQVLLGTNTSGLLAVLRGSNHEHC